MHYFLFLFVLENITQSKKYVLNLPYVAGAVPKTLTYTVDYITRK